MLAASAYASAMAFVNPMWRFSIAWIGKVGSVVNGYPLLYCISLSAYPHGGNAGWNFGISCKNRAGRVSVHRLRFLPRTVSGEWGQDSSRTPLRCDNAGSLRLTSSRYSRSMGARMTPGSVSALAMTLPQGSTIMEWP